LTADQLLFERAVLREGSIALVFMKREGAGNQMGYGFCTLDKVPYHDYNSN
jgi:hypothetical protein